MDSGFGKTTKVFREGDFTIYEFSTDGRHRWTENSVFINRGKMRRITAAEAESKIAEDLADLNSPSSEDFLHCRVTADQIVESLESFNHRQPGVVDYSIGFTFVGSKPKCNDLTQCGDKRGTLKRQYECRLFLKVTDEQKYITFTRYTKNFGRNMNEAVQSCAVNRPKLEQENSNIFAVDSIETYLTGPLPRGSIGYYCVIEDFQLGSL